MDVKALGLTILCCLISVVIEAISASKEGKAWFEGLNQPKFSFSLKIWYVVGGIYYLIFAFILYNLFTGTQSISIAIVCIIMLLNGLSNFLLFKLKNLIMFTAMIVLIFVLLAILVFLLRSHIVLAILALIYLLWLVYDLYYFYKLRKLNQ